MNIMLKTGALVAALAAIFAVPSGSANAAGNQCWTEYRACIAAGYDQDLCMDSYYYCRFGYYPVKSNAGQVIGDRRN